MVGGSNVLSARLSNTGTSSITISSVSDTGPGYTEQLELRLEELEANREETSPAEGEPAVPPIPITRPGARAEASEV
jgi:hypothetical protein